MKTHLIIIALSLFAIDGYSRRNTLQEENTGYGFGISEISSGTGHGVGYSMNGSVIRGRKSLEIGLVYSDRESKISGGDFIYRVFLGSLNRVSSPTKILKPYIQYNLLYQRGTSYDPDLVTLGNTSYEIDSEPGMIATIGHYLGCGNKAKIMGNIYLDSYLGIGYYVGSLSKVHHPNTVGIHHSNNGITYSIKIGLGYTFN